MENISLDKLKDPYVVILLLLSVVLFFRTSIAGFLFPIPKALDKNEWREFEITNIERVSHDVRKFRFKLPSKEHIFGLPVGTHVAFRFFDEEGKTVQRSYTPITSDDEKGYAEFVIKVYSPTIRDVNNSTTGVMEKKAIPGGRMSMHLDNLKVGDKMQMLGPKGSLLYKGNGRFQIIGKHNRVFKRIALIAGGTGITPMLQYMRAILKDKSDRTEIALLFANVSENDILFRQELESLPRDRVKVMFTVDRLSQAFQDSNAKWPYEKGYITADLIKSHLPPNDGQTLFIVCGNVPMIKNAVIPAFEELGIKSDKGKAIPMINNYYAENFFLCG